MSDDNFPAPNWTEWRNRTYVQLWQAVALTLGVEPSSVRKKGSQGKPAFSDIDGFNQRLEVAVAQLNQLEWERPNALPRSVANHWNLSVSLVSFADLADLTGWPFDASIPRAARGSAHEIEKTIARIDEVLLGAIKTPNLGQQASIHQSTSSKPVQRTAAQDEEILCEIKKQGYAPRTLPRNTPGKPGVKSVVRAALKNSKLFTGTTIFDKAWERLTANADIVIQG